MRRRPERRRLLLHAVLGALLAGLPGVPRASALPAPVLALGPAWRELGSGEARLFGLHLYDARLWVTGPVWREEAPFALALEYARDFSRRQLVGRSLDEMRRLGSIDAAQLTRWQLALEAVLPDVAPGHSIVGVSLPGRGALFYHQGRLTGEVADPAFARAFFAIWLDPRTRQPALRTRLLGAQP